MNTKRKTIILILCISIALIVIFVPSCTQIEKFFNSITGNAEIRDVTEASDQAYGGNNGAENDTGIDNNENTVNIAPLAIMEIYQQNSDGFYIEVDNPVFFTAENSNDADNDKLEFRWEIEGKIIEGMEQEHTFKETGKHTIILIVSDGEDQSLVTRQIEVMEITGNIIIEAEHKLTVEIQYVFENRGPGKAEDLFCFIEVPQTHLPYQVVIDRRSNYKKGDRVFNDESNIIAQFNLGDLEPGKSKTAYINCDVILYEYYYGNPTGSTSYGFWDSNLRNYTKNEYFIDSDSNIIKTAADSVVGQEKDPLVIAEELYEFVSSALEYDYDVLDEGKLGFNYASQVLQTGNGICTDYSILYAALCRAAGIPAMIVQGVPVFSILNESDKELSYGHAWVEINLPGYGWIPIDVTSEEDFMEYNYLLNLQTYKGSGIFHKSLEIDGENYYPGGFYYSWRGESEPNVVRKISYRVKGFDQSELKVSKESSYLDDVSFILSEYSAAVNHINNAHKKDWIFNDPEEIAIEQTFLRRLVELSGELKNISWTGSFNSEHDSLIDISKDIIYHKNSQISCMQAGDYDCSIARYNDFNNSFNSLFEYFNGMVESYNEKY